MGSTLKRLLGNDWGNLHPNIQQRFATEPKIAEYVLYRGSMETIQCSIAGKIFAYLARMFTHSFAPYEGKNVRIDVRLYRKTGLAGICWHRIYYYEGVVPHTITSVKREDNSGHMVEYIGSGFGIILKATVIEGHLHFRSTRYFWQLGKLRIPLPHWLTPGQTHVAHEDLHDGRFRVTIAMNHAYLGRTFYQTGVFTEA